MNEFIKQNITSILAVLWSLASFIFIYLLMHKNVDIDKNIAMIIVGFLTTTDTLILTFYFGSSTGSKKKTEMMSEAKKPGVQS